MMTRTSQYTFIGDQQRRTDSPHHHSPTDPEPYIAAPELIMAVNLAIDLKRPLLLEGEAGCGKTCLARAVAYELGLPFYRWDVRSTSKAQDGFYTYDYISRLHDVHIHHLELQRRAGGSEEQSGGPGRRDPGDPGAYLTLGSLGQAITQPDGPAVVLIDEIDKADIDFPNDLLGVLDQWRFDVTETGKTITAAEEHKPIVIITSNKEKGNLPHPFLRRCIYHYIGFPETKERLKGIVDVHSKLDGQPPPPEVVDKAIDRFIEIRKASGLHKLPGTSEFLDWLKALHRSSVALQPSDLDAEKPIPYPGLLFKLRADWKQFVAAR
jgi:MoxR-like ATPase